MVEPEVQNDPVGVLHHINFKTTRKDAMVAWYKAVLNMRVHYDTPMGAFMSNDAANHRVALLAIPGLTPDPDRRFHDGLHHSAFGFPKFEDLNATYLRLRKVGIEPLICVDHRMTFSYYYEDPDGNLVEMQIDSFGDWAVSTDWMIKELPLITDSPQGILLDPARVAEDISAGLEFEEIRKRSDEGRYRPGPDYVPDLRLPPPPPGAPPLFKYWKA